MVDMRNRICFSLLLSSVLLGWTPCEIIVGSDLDIMWVAHEPMRWPSINGEPCDMELVMENRIQDGTITEYLYNIPAQIGTDTCFLRCGRTFSDAGENGHSTYQLYGVWVGYDEITFREGFTWTGETLLKF